MQQSRNCAGQYNLNRPKVIGFKKERTLKLKERFRISGQNIKVGYRLHNLIICDYYLENVRGQSKQKYYPYQKYRQHLQL